MLRQPTGAACPAGGTQEPSARAVPPSAELERDITEFGTQIMYSQRYYDDAFEYRHVILPKQLAKYVPAGRLLSEAEWRAIGVQQSRGWVHYMIHKPEPHILLFRREKDYQAKYAS